MCFKSGAALAASGILHPTCVATEVFGNACFSSRIRRAVASHFDERRDSEYERCWFNRAAGPGRRKQGVTVTSVVRARQATRFVCRSYMAVVLVPEPPIVEWIAEIDQRMKGAENFVRGAPVVLDLNAVTLSKLAIAHLISELEQRDIHVLGLENVDPLSAGKGVPPLLRSSHGGSAIAEKRVPDESSTDERQMNEPDTRKEPAA